MKFFRCKQCGNIIAYIEDSGVKVICCGEKMEEMIPQTADSALEKHVPLVKIDNTMVKDTVGSTLHPMEDEHYIMWIAISTNKGNQRKTLVAGEKPEVCFSLCDDEKMLEVYSYCNIHGLWKA